MNLDPRTVLITLTGVLLAIALQRARGFVIEWFSKALDWLFWNLSRRMQRGFARRLSLRRYCTTQLSGTTSKHLELPGAFSKKLDRQGVRAAASR